jgi:hypothetical protein
MLGGDGLPAGGFIEMLLTRRPVRASTRTTETARGKAAVASSDGGGKFSARRPVTGIDTKISDTRISNPKNIVLRTTSEQKRILLFYPIIPGILPSANLCF